MSDEIEPHVVRLRESASGWREVDGPRLTPDDPYLTGLDEDRAKGLVRSNWALQAADVEDARAFYPDDEDEDGDAGEGEAEEPPDIDKWADWNEDDWLDMGYEQRAADVREGRVDEHLDAIEDAERSENVLDAVEARRAELED